MAFRGGHQIKFRRVENTGDFQKKRANGSLSLDTPLESEGLHPPLSLKFPIRHPGVKLYRVGLKASFKPLKSPLRPCLLGLSPPCPGGACGPFSPFFTTRAGFPIKIQNATRWESGLGFIPRSGLCLDSVL